MIQSLDFSKTTIGIAAGVAGTLFIGYCIYFDQKRIKDPEYKRKVKERKCSIPIRIVLIAFVYE